MTSPLWHHLQVDHARRLGIDEMEGEASSSSDLQAPDDGRREGEEPGREVGEGRSSGGPHGGAGCCVEVERKFVIPEDMEERIVAIGGVLQKHVVFEDAYWDRGDHVLTMADHWVRQRDGQWQLKSPPPFRDTQQKTLQYLETEDENQIVSMLHPLLTSEFLADELDQDQLKPDDEYYMQNNREVDISAVRKMLQKAGCTQIARFRTDRKKYKLDNFCIDLDFADFGFYVGEIEILVEDENEVSQAVARIDALAQKLGVDSEKRVCGKVNAYLKKFNPTLQEKLYNKHFV